MHVTRYLDARTFLAEAGAHLMASESVNCLGLGVAYSLLGKPGSGPDCLLLGVESSFGLHGAAWVTPPGSCGLSLMPERASALIAAYLAELGDPISDVVGPKRTVDAFKDLWIARRGSRLRSTIEQRIYRVEHVVFPRPAPGELRVATLNDWDFMLEWTRCYVRDCGLRIHDAALREKLSAAVANGKRVLWERDGHPVSMAGYGGETPSSSRISWVYTPDEQRGRGYATALVAALSQNLLREGRQACVLFADVANPSANGIYRALGYEAVGDATQYMFED